MYNAILRDSIESEKNEREYLCSDYDRKLLNEMLCEINLKFGTDLHYLAELDAYRVVGSGEILQRYIGKFEGHFIKAIIITHIACERLPNAAELAIAAYRNFQESDEYISMPNEPAPAHIYVRYDNAIRKLKPKKYKYELLELLRTPRDAIYLPFTLRMVASWQLSEFEEVLHDFLKCDSLTEFDIGIKPGLNYYPPLAYFKRELKFAAITGLSYYPCERSRTVIEGFINDDDFDIRSAAKKALVRLERSVK